MEPVFTIPYPEFAVASQLSRHLPSSKNYSMFVPASRQQKGVDLMVTHREGRVTRAMSVQVKSSRTYCKERAGRLRYDTWYSNFEAPPEADFVFLIALYPKDDRAREG